MSTETDMLDRKYQKLRGITLIVSILAIVFGGMMVLVFFGLFDEAARADEFEEAASSCEALLDRHRTKALIETGFVERECSEATRRQERMVSDYEDCLRDQALSDLYWHACERRLLQRRNP